MYIYLLVLLSYMTRNLRRRILLRQSTHKHVKTHLNHVYGVVYIYAHTLLSVYLIIYSRLDVKSRVAYKTLYVSLSNHTNKSFHLYKLIQFLINKYPLYLAKLHQVALLLLLQMKLARLESYKRKNLTPTIKVESEERK